MYNCTNKIVYVLFLSLSGISVSSSQNTFLQTEALIPSLATGVVKKITGIIQTMKQMVGDLISTIIPRWILKGLLMYVGPEAYHLKSRWYASGKTMLKMLNTDNHWQYWYCNKKLYSDHFSFIFHELWKDF